MSLPSIILVGGGGHCISCIDVILDTQKFHIAGILDVKEKVGTSILDIPVIGTDEDLANLKSQYDYFIVTVGHIKNSQLRENLFEKLKKLSLPIPAIVSRQAYVSPWSKIGAGTMVMHGVIINAAAQVGENCIINTNALIEHEVVIADHCHISTSAVCNGQVIVGKGSFVGSNATVKQNVKIGEGVLIGAGSVVLNDVANYSTVVGNPAKKV